MSYLGNGMVKHIHKVRSLSHIMYVFYNSHIKLINRHKSYQSYNSEIETALNKQIQSEQLAAIDYLDIAVRFLHPSVAYAGTGGYFMKMYEEELLHMEVLINYQLNRGGWPKVRAVNKSEQSTTATITPIAAFALALEMEKMITEQLENVVSTAERFKDYQCADFITSTFLKDQMLSIHELSQHVTVLNRLCGDEHALWDYDQYLSKSYPYTLKL